MSIKYIYTEYCVAKEKDMKSNVTIGEQVSRKKIEHDDVFQNWNRHRLSQLKTKTLSFDEIQKDREIFAKRFNFYKEKRHKKLENTIKSFVDDDKVDRLLKKINGKIKSIELQHEFLDSIAKEYMDFDHYLTARDKFERRKKEIGKLKSYETHHLEKIHLSNKEGELLKKYLILIDRKEEKNILKMFEEYKIIIDAE